MGPLRFKPAALSLALFLDITFTLCVVWGLLFPGIGMHRLLEAIFPGFRWISVGSFILGLVESSVYGLYAAAVFVPLYNYFWQREEARLGRSMRHERL